MLKKFMLLLLAAGLLLTSCSSDDAAESQTTTDDGRSVLAAETLSAEEYERYSFDGVQSAFPDIPWVMQFYRDGEMIGDAVTYDEYRYYQLLYKNYFDGGDNSYWDTNPDMRTRVESLYLRELMRNHAVIEECEKYGISLTEEELAEIDRENAETVAAFGGSEYFLEALDQYYLTEYYYNEQSKQFVLYEKLEEYYTENGQILTLDADIRGMLNTDDFIRCKHILIMNDTGDDIAANRQLAEDLLARLQAGEDFDTLMNEYTEDTGLEANPDGYYFFRGEMEETFEAASFALAEGEMSGIVESSYGYHIILRCEKENTYMDENFETIKATYLSLRFYQLLDDMIADWQIAYCDDFPTYQDWSYAEAIGNLYTAAE